MEQISYHWRKICLFDYKWALNGVPWSAKHWRNPNAFSIFVQSLFRIVFSAFVSLLSTFLIKSMYSGVNIRKQVNRCQGRLPAEVTSLLLKCLPHHQLFPCIISSPITEINLPLFLLVQNYCWVSDPHFQIKLWGGAWNSQTHPHLHLQEKKPEQTSKSVIFALVQKGQALRLPQRISLTSWELHGTYRNKNLSYDTFLLS